MGKINILQPNVFNMISAGEVVERPASVVKELVENAIDAGSTEIDVYVEDGGTKKIVVSDNGTGIAADDLRAAFLPHATSKLKEIIDLDTVSTLGFRGEALASIASVSEITLISRAKNSDIARKIVLSGGKVLSECDDSRAEGTIITVENLFFNTPARLKFLKKPSTELGYITDTVEKIALANPNLKLTLSSENGNILVQEGGDLRDSVMAVYPNLDIERFIPVNRTSSAGITVSGYVSEVDYTAPTRSKQTVIVNGRVVFHRRGQSLPRISRKTYVSDVRTRHNRTFRRSRRQRSSCKIRSPFQKQKRRIRCCFACRRRSDYGLFRTGKIRF